MRYRILHPLESGPDIRVYRVADAWESGTARVLTLLPTDLSDESKKRGLEELFMRRKSLDHPHLVPVLDVAFRGKRMGFVSEFIDGLSLSKELDVLDWQQRRTVGLQLAELLAYLHGKGCFCGCIKPSQLFVVQEGRLIANFLTLGSSHFDDRQSGDWIRYAAPEFLCRGRVDHRSDLYSLGMVLYHLFTGHAPYLEKDLASLRNKQIVAFPVRPRELNPRIPNELEQLIQELTHKDPHIRPSSVEYVVAALRGPGQSRRRAVPRFRSVLVGRDSELAGFRKLLPPILGSTGAKFVGISGVSGIGKTGLMEQFGTIAAIHGAETYTVSHHPGSGIMEAFIQLLHRIKSDPEVSRDSSFLFAGWHQNSLNPKNFARDFLSLLTQLSKGKPIVLCVNDLQWMDEGSLVIYRAIFNQKDLPVIVIGNNRTDEPPGHWGELRSELLGTQRSTEFELRGLKEEEIRHLITHLLSHSPSEGLSKKIITQCSGNPFYVYEYLRALRETGELVFHSGRWKWDPRPENPRVPSSVADSIAARLKGVCESDLKFLNCLSLLARPIPTAWLAKIVRVRVGGLEERLRSLERLDFVSVAGSLDRPVVNLSHDWLGRVIREGLSIRKKRGIHRDLADFLEGRYVAAKDPGLREAVVRHALEAGNKVQVRKYIWEAIEWLEEGHLYQGAAELVERGLGCDSILLNDGRSVDRVAELFYFSGSLDKSLKLCGEILVKEENLTDQQRASIYSLQARIHLLRGQTGEAISLLEKAIPSLHMPEDQELFAEIQGELLCSLCRGGEFKKAQALVTQVLQYISFSEGNASLDKMYHALCYYHKVTGNLSQAISWEVKSIQKALDQDKLVRSAGRIANLGYFFIEKGAWALGQQLADYSLQLGEEMDNAELVLHAKSVLSLHARKRGAHRESNRILNELVSMNRQANHNSHAAVELSIDLAKNFNCQLLPENALYEIKECRKILAKDKVQHSLIDATLTLGWTWLLLGSPDEALKAVSHLNSKDIPRERGRYLLLKIQIHWFRGHYGRAWQAACKADDLFPSSMPYYRSKIRLVQGKLLLKRGRVQEAKRYIQEGLSIAKEEFYFPMMVQGWMLYAEYLSAAGNPSRARTYCLRAQQVAAKVERPALHSEVLHIQGRIEAELGNREVAMRCYSQGLQILKERLLHISPTHQQAFTKQFIRPIEADRDQILPEESRSVPRYFVQLRHLASLLGETRYHGKIGEKTLQFVRESLPSISANLLLRKTPTEELSIVASIGRCGRTGKELVTQSWHGEQLFLPPSVPGMGGVGWDSLGIPIRCNGHLLGLIYVECQGQGISEDELDFLSCVARSLEFQLAERTEMREVKAENGDFLRVDEDRVMVGKHASMQKLFAEMQGAASSDSTVLILGESGTGKELVAQGIHSLSDRGQERFLPINCSALPPDLIESELFGHSRGSFTGAVENKMGLFEAASGGTLFLDEIATMPIDLQSRLLRVLDEKKIRRLGETEQRSIDVRIVAASNQALSELIRKGEFREDLYHRLNVYLIRIPPLRERLSDLPLLVQYILAGLNREAGHAKTMTPEALSMLSRYSYPGNVRELKNIVESAYHLTVRSAISTEDIAWRLDTNRVPQNQSSSIEAIVEDLASGKGDFWRAVRDPFLGRDMSRQEVRQIVALGLEACNGRYRRLIEYFNLPGQDYKRFLSFLSNHNCKVDFRRFRGGMGH